MPVNSGSDYSHPMLRNTERRPATAAPVGFWHVFAAVLLALVVHSVGIRLFDEVQARKIIAELDAEIAKMESEFSVADVVRPATPRRASPQPQLPVLPDSIQARAKGAEYACVHGRIYRRLSNGWDHVGGRCRTAGR